MTLLDVVKKYRDASPEDQSLIEEILMGGKKRGPKAAPKVKSGKKRGRPPKFKVDEAEGEN